MSSGRASQGCFSSSPGSSPSAKRFAAAPALEKLVALASVFVAAPLAVFAAEHIAGPRVLMSVVPDWIPARLFWAYFVGFALLAAALSLTFKKYLRWSTLLLAIMFFVFVASIHIPNVVTHFTERAFWTVTLRDFGFATGILTFAASLRKKDTLTSIGRLCFAVPVLFFGVEYLLHPLTASGVPLAKLTPAWVPFPPAMGLISTGAILLVGGTALLLGKKSRRAATAIGLIMTVATVVLYLPSCSWRRVLRKSSRASTTSPILCSSEEWPCSWPRPCRRTGCPGRTPLSRSRPRGRHREEARALLRPGVRGDGAYQLRRGVADAGTDIAAVGATTDDGRAGKLALGVGRGIAARRADGRTCAIEVGLRRRCSPNSSHTRRRCRCCLVGLVDASAGEPRGRAQIVGTRRGARGGRGAGHRRAVGGERSQRR